MRRIRFLVAPMAVMGLALSAASSGAARGPFYHQHYNFTSDPYQFDWCGIDGIAVDKVVEQVATDVGGGFIDNFSVNELFTATVSGKAMTVQMSKSVRLTDPTPGPNNTFDAIIDASGGMVFRLPTKHTVKDSGHVVFTQVFDSNGNLIDEEFVSANGNFQLGCDAIVAALS